MRIKEREKKFIGAGVCFLGLVLVFQLVIYPAWRRAGDLERLILQKEKELTELRALKKELLSLRQMRADLSRRLPPEEKNLPPLSRLDGWVERAELKQNIRAIKPSPAVGGGSEEMIVEVTLEKTDLPHLTRFLYLIQSSPGAFNISRISIKPRYTTPRFIDVSLQIVFYRS